MNIPVLIPAHNEAEKLPKLLQALPLRADPIVIANGCSDNTAEIARSYGVTVIEREERSKTRALQAGLKLLYKTAEFSPFIMADADTVPLFPSRWSEALLRVRASRTNPNRPAFICGGLVYTSDKDFIGSALRSGLRIAKHYRDREKQENGVFAGANTLVDCRGNKVLDEIICMPDYWPGEDVAIKDIILSHGGQAYKSSHPGTFAVTHYDRFVPIMKRLRIGREAASRLCHESYLADSPPNADCYNNSPKHSRS